MQKAANPSFFLKTIVQYLRSKFHQIYFHRKHDKFLENKEKKELKGPQTEEEEEEEEVAELNRKKNVYMVEYKQKIYCFEIELKQKS